MKLLDAVGNTPLVKLDNITEGLNANIYAKLEFVNPGGSTKDRIAKYMVEKAEKEGKLKKGDTIIENSSGNTAMGLAIVARQKGYKLKIVIRDTTSREKLKMLEVLGVDVITVDAAIPPEREDSYNNLAKTLANKHPDYYYIDQHNNLDNNEAHYMTTGPEIWEQTRGKIDYFVLGIGTGGTICGAGKYLKEKNPNIKVKNKFDQLLEYLSQNNDKVSNHLRRIIQGELYFEEFKILLKEGVLEISYGCILEKLFRVLKKIWIRRIREKVFRQS